MRTFLLSACVMSVAFLAGCEDDDEEFFGATLRGEAEVDPVETDASGEASFVLDNDDAELEYTLEVDDIDDVIAAHIHLGAPGENGPIIAFLFDPDDPVSVTAPTVLALGEIEDADVIAVQGFAGTFAAVIAEIEAGNTYVNVHTLANPGGEIRGQIERR